MLVLSRRMRHRSPQTSWREFPRISCASRKELSCAPYACRLKAISSSVEPRHRLQKISVSCSPLYSSSRITTVESITASEYCARFGRNLKMHTLTTIQSRNVTVLWRNPLQSASPTMEGNSTANRQAVNSTIQVPTCGFADEVNEESARGLRNGRTSEKPQRVRVNASVAE